MSEAVNKSDLVTYLCLKGNFKKPEAEKAVTLIFDAIRSRVVMGESVNIKNFGVFKPKLYAPRNIKGFAGDHKLDERIRVTFTPSENLLKNMNDAHKEKDEVSDFLKSLKNNED